MAEEKYYVEVDDDGTRWYAWPGTDRRLHRLDGPAIEYPNGRRDWYQNGLLHRVDGPAVESPNGRREWYQNDLLHRLDGPAVDRPDGERAWVQNGLLHRLDGPAVVYANGTKEWWLNDVRHTEDAWRAATQSMVELTVAEIETLLGKRIKIVK